VTCLPAPDAPASDLTSKAPQVFPNRQVNSSPASHRETWILSVLLAAYGLVFVTEMVGDKTLYVISALATRYRLAAVLTGVVAAFALKMLAAVLLGQFLAGLPREVLVGVSVATFSAMAFALWRKRPGETGAEDPIPPPAPRVALLAFAAIFFSEWADAGQIAAATLSARYHAPALVWSGATLALCTKGAIAVTLGVGLRRYLPRRLLRGMAVAACLAMAVAAAVGFDG
jgi:putative Ca2+/H+ antiporter (TMEM165/GDT1 family)